MNEGGRVLAGFIRILSRCFICGRSRIGQNVGGTVPFIGTNGGGTCRLQVRLARAENVVREIMARQNL